MRILALDAALSRCSVSLVQDGTVLATRSAVSGRGQSAVLAPMVEAVLLALPEGSALDAVAVTVGPGSFTGLRTAIALAHGLGAAGCPVIGVTVAEALAQAAGDVGERTLWVAIDSRRDRIFLDIGGMLRPIPLTDLPTPATPLAIAGDAAVMVASVLAERGFDIHLTDIREVDATDVAAVAQRRIAGILPPLEAQPLYVDPPEAKLPAGGLRPSPVPTLPG